MPGRKAMPIDLLVLKGSKNLTKTEIEQRKAAEGKLKAKKNKLRPPSWLDDIAKKIFKEIINESYELDYITNLDIGQLSHYCYIESRIIEMQNNQDHNVKELMALIKESKSLAGEFGLTPSARAKLAIRREEEKPKSREEKLFGEKL